MLYGQFLSPVGIQRLPESFELRCMGEPVDGALPGAKVDGGSRNVGCDHPQISLN